MKMQLSRKRCQECLHCKSFLGTFSFTSFRTVIHAEKPATEKPDSPPSDPSPAPWECKSCVVLKSLYTFPSVTLILMRNIAFAVLIFSGMCPSWIVGCSCNPFFTAKTGRTRGNGLNCKKDQGKTLEKLPKNKDN